MNNKKNRVCPVSIAGLLDNKIRRWLQNPEKILKPYIKKGMTVLDIGCGPGFFSIELAKLVGKSGKVIASDLQKEMLQKLKNKIKGTEVEKRITLHKCTKNKIGLQTKVDFILAFYMVHEVPNINDFFSEIKSILKPDGQLLVVEPSFHVSKNAFEKTIEKAINVGFKIAQSPKSLFSRRAIFTLT